MSHTRCTHRRHAQELRGRVAATALALALLFGGCSNDRRSTAGAPRQVHQPAGADLPAPYARLALPGHPLTPIAAPLDQELRRLGVRSARAYLAQPKVMLVVYELNDRQALRAAKDALIARRPSAATLEVGQPPPFYPEGAENGRWLLVTGFTAEKPPSMAAERLRRQFLAAW